MFLADNLTRLRNQVIECHEDEAYWNVLNQAELRKIHVCGVESGKCRHFLHWALYLGKMNYESFASHTFYLRSVRKILLKGDCKASDSRDIIFCTWGLGTMQDLLKPDYDKDEKIVFELAARECIAETSSLEVLRFSDGIQTDRYTDKSKLSSWVADWTRNSEREELNAFG